MWTSLDQYIFYFLRFDTLSTNFTKWSNALKQFAGKLATNCLSVFDHFVGLALKGLIAMIIKVVAFLDQYKLILQF